MTPALSRNTQAILLLTAPLIAGPRTQSIDLLTPGEYRRLARHLRDLQREPADLLVSDATDLLHGCAPVIEEKRLERLLGRGFLLSQVLERWQSRSIWVVSRADAEYPRRLKVRLREESPVVLYGCGEIGLIESGGLAVVGSRNVDDEITEYTMDIGRLSARAGRTVVSGGARGIDRAAMRGAVEAGGKVVGVLADSLESTAMNRENRNLLIEGQLLLVSPYDPGAGFNVGNAMQRNKVIYALADAALVVSSDFNKGGTWSGAIQQLEKLRLVPVYVRSTGEASPGLDALKRKGAMPWPNPSDPNELTGVFNRDSLKPPKEAAVNIELFSYDVPAGKKTAPGRVSSTATTASKPDNDSAPPPALTLHANKKVGAAKTRRKAASAIPGSRNEEGALPKPASNPAEELFTSVRKIVPELLKAPKNEGELAALLGVSSPQARAWLARLVEEGLVEKLNKPVRYASKEIEGLFGH